MSTNAQPRVLGRWCRTSRWCTLVHARRAFVAPADATSASCDVRSRDDSGRQRPRVAPSADRNVHGPRRLRGVTSASRNVERREGSEPQRQRTATTAWREVSEPQRQAPLRQRAARRQRAATSERRAVSEPQRQARHVKCATSSAPRQARHVKRATSIAPRQALNVKRATSSAPRQARHVKRTTSSAQRQARNVKRATSSAQRQARNVGAALRQSAETWRGAKLVYAVVGNEQDRSRETTVPGTDSSQYKSIYLGIMGPSVLG